MRRAFLLCMVLFFAVTIPLSRTSTASADEKPLPGISEKTTSMQKFPGFFTYYWDAREGKIFLQVDKWDTEFLYVESLPYGVGSNDIGLDRGQPGETQVAHFERSGPRVLLVAENERFRAVTDDAVQREAVKQAFAQSVIWGFDAVAADGDAVLVDATSFFLRDGHDIVAKLQATHQGNYHLDPTRCAIYLPRTKNFPENSDVEATLTFVGENPGHWVDEVTPQPTAITVHDHYSFVQAPPPGFHMREFDPRSGFFCDSVYGFCNACG